MTGEKSLELYNLMRDSSPAEVKILISLQNDKPAGVGGGGSPNRTISGTVVTSLKMNPELRFQAAQHNTDTDPRLVGVYTS